jgi:cytochrome c biogenesis protein CcmG, thiol:disulfide interchange protein DsbE
MSRRRGASLALAVLVVLGGISILAQGRAAGAPGTPAPDVALPDGHGRLVRLSDLKGHVVLVDFWASWCAPCRTSFPKLDALYRELHPRGLDVLAVNVDERQRDADGFLEGHPHAMPVLFDPKGQTPQAFAVRGMPTSVLLDRSGTIRFTHVGYTDKTVDTYREEIDRLLGERQR